jgi:hypothetical protein
MFEIETQNLTKSFGRLVAVQNLNLVLKNLCAANAGNQGRDAVAGVLGQTIDQVHDARIARRAPSLQLSGRADHPVGLSKVTRAR